MAYNCSICREKVVGDLVTLQEHTDKHIIELVKHDHPDWAEPDGMCRKCYEYYKAEIGGSPFKDAPCALRTRKIKSVWQKVTNLFGKP